MSKFECLVLYTKKFGEKKLLVSLLSNEYGFIKSMAPEKSRIFQVGNLVEVKKFGREGGLGFVSGDVVKPYGLLFLQSRNKLLSLIEITEILNTHLPENQQDEHLYQLTKNLLEDLYFAEPDIIDILVIRFKLSLLKLLGYGIDFSKCSVTGNQDVAYISPRTGAVVSSEIGEKYQNVAFKIPNFLLNHDLSSNNVDAENIILGKKIVNHFLSKINQHP